MGALIGLIIICAIFIWLYLDNKKYSQNESSQKQPAEPVEIVVPADVAPLYQGDVATEPAVVAPLYEGDVATEPAVVAPLYVEPQVVRQKRKPRPKKAVTMIQRREPTVESKASMAKLVTKMSTKKKSSTKKPANKTAKAKPPIAKKKGK